jgi:hypothetical protein
MGKGQRLNKYKKSLRKALRILAKVELENEALKAEIRRLRWKADTSAWGS